MKVISKITFLIGIFCLFSNNLLADAQVQIFHNSSDPAANIVDIYVNGMKPDALDDFNYREATPYIPIPAGVDVVVTVANSNSQNVMDGVIQTFELGQLVDNQEYVVIANGVLNTDVFNSPDMDRNIAFDLKVIPGKRMSGSIGQVAVSIYHGVTDAPAVDVYIASSGQDFPDEPQVPNLDYAQSTEFLMLSAGFYNIRITAAGNKDVIVGDYSAPLTTAAGIGAVVVASGFLSPEDENNGAVNANIYSFGLLAVASAGIVIPLPQVDFAAVQIIHNAADPAAEVVDIYVGGMKVGDDIRFRNATTYVPVVAGEPVNVSINLPTSNNSQDGALKTFTLPALEKNSQTTIIANGVAGEDFINGGEDRDISLNLFASPSRAEANNSNQIDVNIFHGSTDAPAVDIYADINGDPLVPNFDYGAFTGYVSLEPADYELTVTVAGNKDAVAGRFIAPLSDLAGQTAVVFASGFLDTEAQPGDVSEEFSFGLYAAFPNGLVIPLEKIEEEPEPMAYVQIIHNAADPAAKFVDIYIDGNKVLTNFEFRSATQYLSLAPGIEYEVSVNLPNSTSVDDGQIGVFNLPALMADTDYVVVANGVAGDGFTNGADGRDITFQLFPTGGRKTGSNAEQVDINVFHGSTDAPAVDIYADLEADPLVPNLDYGSFTNYVSLPADNYILSITVAGNKEALAGQFIAPLSALQGEALVVFASGFLSTESQPDNVTEEYAFGIYAALADGTVIQLPVYEETDANTAFIQIVHNSADPAAAEVDIYVNGELALDNFSFRSATRYLPFNVNESYEISVNLPTSTSVEEGQVKTFVLPTLEAGAEYIAIANGVVGEGFNSGAEGRDIAFNLHIIEGMAASSAENLLMFNAFHGVTDAPAVDVFDDLFNPVILNLDYANDNGWTAIEVTQDWDLTVTAHNSPETVVGTYYAPLTSFVGSSILVMASGFLSTADEPNATNDQDFGLFVVTSRGDVIPLDLVGSVNKQLSNLASLYPNPAREQIQIDINQAIPSSFKVYNSKSELMLSQNVTSTNVTLDLTSFNSGTYFILVETNKGQVFKKFVVNK